MPKSSQADIEGLRTTLLDCLRKMERKISGFGQHTSMDILETHAEVLEQYWQKTVDANLTITSSTEPLLGNFPEASVYINTKTKLKSLMKIRKIFLFNESLTCIGITDVNVKISTFDGTTPDPVLETYAKLLEDDWSKYSKAFSEIFESILELDSDGSYNIQAKKEVSKYFKVKSTYIESKILLKRLQSNK